MAATLSRLNEIPNGKIIQLTCVYESLTPNILTKVFPRCLHIADVSELQFKKSCQKIPDDACLLPARMNVEQLAYADNAFSTIVIFVLLHEMPLEARHRVLSECMRVLSYSSTLLYTEYTSLPSKHILYRFYPTRFILTRLEPFLSSYWDDDILEILRKSGRPYGKEVEIISHTSIFLISIE